MILHPTTTVIAGCPGAGKTTTLLDRFERLLAAGCLPEEIGFLTFSRTARSEAVRRASARFGLAPADLPWVTTIHSACYRQSGLTNSEVLKRGDFPDLAEAVNYPLHGLSAENGSAQCDSLGDRLLYLRNLARVKMQPLADTWRYFGDRCTLDQLEAFAQDYDRFFADSGLLDFTAMLERFLDPSVVAPRLRAVIVDEAQDLSRLQWAVITKMATQAEQLVVAGDDDQAIYQWAGADVASFVDLAGKTQVLGQSYRCSEAVQAFARSLTHRLSSRRDKKWRARDETGYCRLVARADDMNFEGDGETYLLLARNHKFLGRWEQLVRSSGMPYIDSTGQDWGVVIDAAAAWQQLQQGYAVSAAAAVSLYRQLVGGLQYTRGAQQRLRGEDASRPINAAALREQFGLLVAPDQPWQAAFTKITAADKLYLETALQRDVSCGRIEITTVHAAKGQEADHVGLLLDQSLATHRAARRDPDSELRVFYTGATRARRGLTLVSATNRGFDL